MKSNWRVNFGNGQVHNTSSKKEALDLIVLQTQYREFCRVEHRVDGEWIRAR